MYEASFPLPQRRLISRSHPLPRRTPWPLSPARLLHIPNHSLSSCACLQKSSTSVSVYVPSECETYIDFVPLPLVVSNLCFTADDVIEDPVIHHDQIRTMTAKTLGITLVQTCRRLYFETDRRPLFSRNTFRFTSAGRARAFLRALNHYHRGDVNDFEIDIRMVNSDVPDLAREWLSLLDQNNNPKSRHGGSLQSYLPKLKTLRLNFESWPKVPMFRAELWVLLQHMLSNAKGLDRIIVIGASKGQGMARRNPWSLAHFVGAADVRFNDLVPRMWSCVKGPDESKIVRWTRENGRIYLEVVTRTRSSLQAEYMRNCPSVSKVMTKDGYCDWLGYEELDSIVRDPMMK